MKGLPDAALDPSSPFRPPPVLEQLAEYGEKENTKKEFWPSFGVTP